MTTLQLNEAPAKTLTANVQPGFYDMQTGLTHPARYADGRLAPIHICNGLPEDVAERLDINIVSGFIIDSLFYTRNELQKLQNKNNKKKAA